MNATVGEWLNNNNFQELSVWFREILDIPDSASLSDLLLLSKEDIVQFFKEVDNSRQEPLPLRLKIDFKRQFQSLSTAPQNPRSISAPSAPTKAVSNHSQSTSSNYYDNSQNSKKYSDTSSRKSSALDASEQDLLNSCEACEASCDDLIRSKVGKLVRRNSKQYEACRQRLDTIFNKEILNSFLKQGVRRQLSQKLKQLQRDFELAQQRIDNIRQDCVTQWHEKLSNKGVPNVPKLPPRDAKESSCELQLRLTDKNRFEMTSTIEEVLTLKQEFERASERYEKGYQLFEDFLKRVDDLIDDFDKLQDRGETWDKPDKSKDFDKNGQHVDRSERSRMNRNDTNDRNANDGDSRRFGGSRDGNKRYDKDHDHYERSSTTGTDRNGYRRDERNRGDARGYGNDRNGWNGWNGNGKDSNYYEQMDGKEDMNQNGIFTTCNPDLVRILNYSEKTRNNEFLCQRIVFDGPHEPAMVISERGFSRGRHEWKIRLNGHCRQATRCSVQQPYVVQIGVMALDLKRFFAGSPRRDTKGSQRDAVARMTEYDKELHFRAEEGDHMGFGLRYFYTYDKEHNMASIGTAGHRNLKQNIRCECRGDENRCIFGDTITMKINLDDKSLSFWKNDRFLVGRDEKYRNVAYGNVTIVEGLTYFPAVCCMGCNCEQDCGFVIDVLR